MPEISGNHRKLRERHGTDFPSPPPEEINPGDNFDVGLLAFRTARGYPSVVQATQYVTLCYEAPAN